MSVIISKQIILPQGGGGGGSLPAGYTRLQYISATTTQWINCDVSLTSPKVELKVNNLNLYSSYYAYFAGYYAVGGHFLLFLESSSTSLGYGIGSTRNSATTSFTPGSEHIINMDTTSLALDGTSLVTYTASLTLPYFGLFGAMNSSGAAYNRSYLTEIDCYYCKIWDGDTLVRDFVPCKNPSSIVGMYDFVSKTFFTNSGSGNFVAGPDAN